MCKAVQVSAVAAPVQQEDPASDADVCYPQFPAPMPGRFPPDRSSFSEQHRIRGYEVRPDQKTTMVTISNLLQEVAGNHAVGMWGRTDTGFANLPGVKDMIFVMTRMQIRMHDYPQWGDIVTVETYFTEEGRLAARRDWVITNAATGAVLGGATSTWVTINMATRKLGRLPDDIKSKFMRFTPKLPRHAIPVDQTKRKIGDMNESEILEGPKQVARRSDMDMNGHINNVTYLGWALESVPQEIYDGHHLFEVEVDFKAECLAGEVVESLCSRQTPDVPLPGVDKQYVHVLRRCNDNGCQELVKCRTSWKPCSNAASNGNGSGAH